MSFPRYPKYKPSGVEWIGEVPEHWSVRPLKRVSRLVTQKAEARTRPIALEHIKSGTGRLVESVTEFQGEGTAFSTGDLLFGKLRPYLAKAWLADSAGEAVGDFHVFRPSPSLAGRYFLYSTLNRDFIDVVDASTYGAKMPRASWEFMGCMGLCLPPIHEQYAIAQFLDRETAKVDAMIEEQEKLINLLAEKRKAVISHAATKGSNASAPMMPSGVEWLGDVPAHWRVDRIATITSKITNGFVGPTRDVLVEEGVRYLQSLHIKDGLIKFETPYYVPRSWSELHNKSILALGDVLVVQTGDIGQVATVTDEYTGCNCHALIILSPIPDRVYGEWLSLALRSEYGRNSLLSIQTGALHPHLNCGEVRDIPIPLPPVKEQAQILEAIGCSSHRLEELRAQSARAAELLLERRSALISAAVTGQIDVRTAVIEPAA